MTNPLTKLLLAQRANGTTIVDLPAELVPLDAAAAYGVQNEVVAAIGPVGAWKVQPMPTTGVPMCSPILAKDVHADGATLRRETLPGLALEVEVAVVLGADLPAKAGGYTASDLRSAIASVHVAFEVLASRYVSRTGVPSLAGIADMQSNGAVVLGPALDASEWPEFGTQSLSLALDGAIVASTEGNATTENVLTSLAWLANHAAERGLPLAAGQVVITGARLGPIEFTGSIARAEGPGLGFVSASFV